LSSRALNDFEIGRVAEAARRSNGCAHRDVALVFALFGTGATPLEIAQLNIRDYLQADGDVRRLSLIREEIAFNGSPRPLTWTEKVIDAVEDYLQHRATKRQGLHGASDYRGFDPNSALFLTEGGTAFQIKTINCGKAQHHLCHSLLDLYRRIFLRSGVAGASTRSARRTIAYKLSMRGATEEEIGKALGIKRIDCVRSLLPKTRPSIPMLMNDLV
jgi:integrase